MTYGQAADCPSAIVESVAPACLESSSSRLKWIASRVSEGFLAVARPFVRPLSFGGCWTPGWQFAIFDVQILAGRHVMSCDKPLA